MNDEYEKKRRGRRMHLLGWFPLLPEHTSMKTTCQVSFSWQESEVEGKKKREREHTCGSIG